MNEIVIQINVGRANKLIKEYASKYPLMVKTKGDYSNIDEEAQASAVELVKRLFKESIKEKERWFLVNPSSGVVDVAYSLDGLIPYPYKRHYSYNRVGKGIHKVPIEDKDGKIIDTYIAIRESKVSEYGYDWILKDLKERELGYEKK